MPMTAIMKGDGNDFLSVDNDNGALPHRESLFLSSIKNITYSSDNDISSELVAREQTDIMKSGACLYYACENPRAYKTKDKNISSTFSFGKK
ncbi:MAG: hypothetical protein ACMZI0_11795 [Symbiopectobacterium sp.]|uniref:hypothetical protein n=1 Tax=Symbiopectobacterium sp. TaxID=2952789 RepID=UPI0039E98486